jgi:molybdopterin molybdotransferase
MMSVAAQEVSICSVEQAREHILSLVSPLPAVRAFVTETVGLVLAEAVVAPFHSPRFSNSAMDGYAVRFSDVDRKSTRLNSSH